MTDTVDRTDEVREVERIIIRFAGDSGDGMQLTGDRFTSASALFGNDLRHSGVPGRDPGASRHPRRCFGVPGPHLRSRHHHPGRCPERAGRNEPCGLKADLHTLESGGTVIINSDAFEERNLAKAGYEHNPLEDNTLDGYTVITAPMTSLPKRPAKTSA